MFYTSHQQWLESRSAWISVKA